MGADALAVLGLSGNLDRQGYFGAYAPSYFDPPAGAWGIKLDNWWELRYVKGGEYWGRITQRHSGGANVVWVDGHVRWVKLPGSITQDNSLWDLQ